MSRISAPGCSPTKSGSTWFREWTTAQRSCEIAAATSHIGTCTRAESILSLQRFDPRRPAVPSKHQTRVNLAKEPGLQTLLSRYAERVIANGFEEASQTPYAYARFSNGVMNDAVTRSVLRDFPDPGDVLAEPSAWRYLNERADHDADESGRPRTRYLYALWQKCPDLRVPFRAFCRSTARDTGIGSPTTPPCQWTAAISPRPGCVRRSTDRREGAGRQRRRLLQDRVGRRRVGSGACRRASRRRHSDTADRLLRVRSEPERRLEPRCRGSRREPPDQPGLRQCRPSRDS